MANRSYYQGAIYNAGAGHVYLPVTILGQGTNNAPTLGEGDPGGVYYSISRAGAGNVLLTTKDAYFGCVYSVMEASSGVSVRWGTPFQNPDRTWSVGVYTTLTTGTVTVGSSPLVATVTAGGSGYTSPPTITYNAANGNVGLKGFTTISGGAVTAITITEGGFGTNNTPPTITLTGGGGSGATATVTLVGANQSASDLQPGTLVRAMMVWRNSQVTP